MRFFLISDNVDSIMGMRLAGIEGTVVSERCEVVDKLEELGSDKNTAVVLVTPVVAEMCEDIINDFKLNRKQPLVCEIPDRHVNKSVTAAIAKCVKEAIGININE